MSSLLLSVSDPFIFFVVVLFVLAISDLVVGVSNDAVNFLNSALGSKVASRKVVMLVASAGIIAGALFSGGMMEVARKGIFSPELFTFANVMVVFAAVMITDIILLDLFNTLAMPTSTTVSIVFELLGAAIAVAVLAIHHQGGSLADAGAYINSSRALIIIGGIFISVVVAFAVGAAAQYISRLIFTFHFERRMRIFGGIWAGVAITALSYFLLIKGLKGASFVPAGFVAWVGEHTVSVLAILLAASTAVMQVCLFLGRNILRFVVLLGTFALAMAFASNDLVNFVGVPMAGLESYSSWSNSGVAASELMMTSLHEPVRTSSLYLLVAGAIMAATLWLSSKARSVTETEINLSRQGAGVERFSPNILSRTIVRTARDIGSVLARILGRRWRARIDSSFVPRGFEGPVGAAPAFDTVRASVNLTIASALIALATSLKLPLSTTYVSFMVAMGSSLADRAWDRDTAVFRVAGVLNIIGGWFLTAAIALSASAVFATIIYFAGIYGVIGLLCLA
ncbi:MAG: inorganic phosphate transporter, partial [Deltaproteobacteria bacterium]|nr:inorganic phosphate transporter [Deltaproteobacteria bacterium]